MLDLARRFSLPGVKTIASERQQLGQAYELLATENRRLKKIIAKHRDGLFQVSRDLEDEVIALNIGSAVLGKREPQDG